jgi:nucleoside-diphosphate-sugar epimerase
MASKVLLTGVAVLIGANLVERCPKPGFPVAGADDLVGGPFENVPAEVDFRQGPAGKWEP